MHGLINLSTSMVHPPLRIWRPLHFKTNNQVPRGWTYGERIRNAVYSDSLKELIWECLYDRPAHRPTLQQLKKRVTRGLEEAITNNAPQETWTDFEDQRDIPAPVDRKPIRKRKTKWNDGDEDYVDDGRFSSGERKNPRYV